MKQERCWRQVYKESIRLDSVVAYTCLPRHKATYFARSKMWFIFQVYTSKNAHKQVFQTEMFVGCSAQSGRRRSFSTI